MGPPTLRPGDLHEPFDQEVPSRFLAASRAAGIPPALAVTVVGERDLVLFAMGEERAPAVESLLDRRAQAAVVAGRTAPRLAEYVRQLVSLVAGHGMNTGGAEPVVVPVRVGDRLRATGYQPCLDPDSLMPALRWELAAALAGQTLGEWAFLEVLRSAS